MKTMFIGLLVLTLIAGVADAEGCATADPEVDTGETAAGRYYVDNDPCQPNCIFSIWVYQESNGQDGLQRCEEYYDGAGCHCEAGSDTIIF